MKVKKLMILLSTAFLMTTGVSSCGDQNPTDEQIQTIYNLAVKSGYEGTYEEWLNSIKGQDGRPGKDGKDGKEITKIIKTGEQDGNAIYTITFSDGTKTTLEIPLVKGDKGDKGDTGAQGPAGEKGDDGKDGKSAYQIYCESHPDYNKTEEEWLDDLVNNRLGVQDTCVVTFMVDNEVYQTQAVIKGHNIVKPEKDPVKEDCIFEGWYLGETEWFFAGYSVSYNIKLTAKFKKIDYVTSTVKEAREALSGSYVNLSGVVAQLTYNNDKVPNGFYLIDNTDSIYVYAPTIGNEVKIGNKIRLKGLRMNNLGSNEAQFVQQYKYKGSIEVKDVTIISNDKGNNSIDTSWMKSATLRQIVETPTSNNITTTTFKVRAIIAKKAYVGFTNYYITDLDGMTTSYFYSVCEGQEFAWLDKFDGKQCEILLSPINCKCNKEGLKYRFIPIQVREMFYN